MVTDADRQAAATFFRSDECPVSVKMVLGMKPDALLNALSAHREAAERAGAQAERASIVAWLRNWDRPLADDIQRGDHVSDQERA